MLPDSRAHANEVAIIVSPLIALMQNQVVALCKRGVRAAYLNSSLSQLETSNVERNLLAGAYDLLYVAPERLLTPRFLHLIQRIQLVLFAIDEVHCVSQWGHDFRPEYMQLSILHKKFPNVPRIALTVTADPVIRAEIIRRLHDFLFRVSIVPIFITASSRRQMVVPNY